MNIYFSINFSTNAGDRMFLVLQSSIYGLGETEMTSTAAGGWETAVKASRGEEISYHFIIKCASGLKMHEAGKPRRLIAGHEDIFIHCSWQGYDLSAPLLTSAFTEIFFPHRNETPRLEEMHDHAVIIATAPAIKPEESILICGENDSLGKWDISRALEMTPCSGARWAASIPIESRTDRLVFKFVLRHRDGGILWEEGDDRVLEAEVRHVYEYSSTALRRAMPRFSGTAVPVFSLRTEDGYGIGDFSCMKPMTDWLHDTGQHILQILPVNDTIATFTWSDSYPYNAISSVALNPIYLNPSLVGDISDIPEAGILEQRRKTLNVSEFVEFEEATALKNDYIRLLFKKFSEKTFKCREFEEYWESNKEWLLPYSAFCALRDEYGTADFHEWGEWSEYTDGLANRMFSDERFRGRMLISIFTQYHLHLQLSEAVSYAASKGIAVMGDIPIGISPCSAEAWTMPESFNMGFSAGAPPDYFSKDGQNWGFPTYNWEKMAEDDYSWWKFRLKKMASYFSMYRIDHILGFFRIWEIPRGIISGIYGHFYPALPYSREELSYRGFRIGDDRLNELFMEDPRTAGMYHPFINGPDTESFKTLDKAGQAAYLQLHDDFFYHRHNGFWKNGAMLKLSELVAATSMTACAEDLGMIPACVPEVLDNLKIATLEIQRMPKTPFTEFADPASYPYLSVCSTGTHDVSTLRGWWEEDPERTQRYYSETLHMEGKAPERCTPEICRAILAAHLRSPSAFAIFPIQDWLAMSPVQNSSPSPAEEQINNPADSRHRWKYRMPVSIERLYGSDERKALAGEIRRLTKDSGR